MTEKPKAFDPFEVLDDMLRRAEALAEKHDVDPEDRNEFALEMVERAVKLQDIASRETLFQRTIAALAPFIRNHPAAPGADDELPGFGGTKIEPG
jgi:hypothetical protein